MLGNVAKMIQEVANNVKAPPNSGAGMGGLGNAGHVASQMAQKAAMGVISMGAGQGGMGTLGGKVNQMASMAAQKLGPAVQKAAYIAALHEAIVKAEGAQMFNLETQKNDLMIKLGNISPTNVKQTALGQAIAQTQDPKVIEQTFQALNELSRKMGEVSRNIISNMR